jgi:3-oxoacyl-[acyl-carrier-protein] synthase III
MKIIGTGSALPEKVLTNLELEKLVDTTDEWIRERTGIVERRIADEKTATSDLAADALLKACRQAGVKPDELDAVIVATSTPDTVYPATACWVQKKLGLRGMAAFDVSAGCSGFLFALEIAVNLLRADSRKRIGVVGAEVMSKVVNWKDRATCVLFGDGAGAAILQNTGDGSGPLAANWGSDGALAPLLYQPAGGTRIPFSEQVLQDMSHTVHMEGNAVFKHAVRTMGDVAVKAMKDAGISEADVKLMIPHQANMRIMEAVRTRVGYPREKQFEIIQKYGNMSAATIPIALDEARRAGRIEDGDIIVMTAFGTGFTWAASVWRW